MGNLKKQCTKWPDVHQLFRSTHTCVVCCVWIFGFKKQRMFNVPLLVSFQNYMLKKQESKNHIITGLWLGFTFLDIPWARYLYIWFFIMARKKTHFLNQLFLLNKIRSIRDHSILCNKYTVHIFIITYILKSYMVHTMFLVLFSVRYKYELT